MDEATSSIDTDTDGKIQAIIQSDALQGRTVITIAVSSPALLWKVDFILKNDN